MDDYFKPRGTIKSSKPDAGDANIRSVPVFGVVKDNVDPVRMGRIQVYLLDLGGDDQDNEDTWITVGQLPTFYGYTQPRGGNGPEDYGTYERNPHSYGAWNSPPDIGTVVICMFVNGDPNFGYYIGCVPNPNALQMVPAIGGTTNVVLNNTEASSYGGATRLPVTNLNPNNPKSNNPDYHTMAKPVHSYTAAIMNQQGIIRDPIRGPISTSAQRESPSRVGWGVSTPGRPIYEGNYTDASVVQAALADNPNVKVVGRKGGHSIVMDDGDVFGNDQLVRIRTALGHQILMSDNGQTLMILHSNGQSYIELGKEGTIDMFSTNSVNIRTQGDLNLHADNDVNINAAKKLNIQADSITVSSEKDYKQRVGGDNILYTLGKFTHKVGGAMSLASSGVASFSSSLVTFINGLFVNLNTGQTYVTPKEVPIPTNVAHTDTLYDKAKGFLAAPGKLISIVSRAPAHAPWANAGQGVNIPTTLNADEQLSSSPSSALSLLNIAAGAVPSVQATLAAAATVPAIGPISEMLGYGPTSAMLSGMVTNVGCSAAASAAAAGGGIVQTSNGAIPIVGKFGLTPQQLQNSGTIKPGSASLVMANAQKPGATLGKVLPPTLFTGKAGAENVTAIANSTAAQAEIAKTALQQGQIALTQIGAITGKEAAGDSGGAVLAATTAGIPVVANAFNEAANKIAAGAGAGAAQELVNKGQAVADTATRAIGTVTKAADTAATFAAKVPALGGAADSFSGLAATFNAGGFAANLGAIGGAFSAISGFLGKLGGGISNVINQARGIAANAFNSIKNALPTLKPNVPQDLEAINASAKASESRSLAAGATAAVTGAAVVAGTTGATGSVLTSAANALGNLKTTVTTVINSAGSVVTNAANTLAKTGTTISTASVDSAVASGVDMLPGGQDAISSRTDYSKQFARAIPGTGSIKTLVDNASTAVNNGISLSNAISTAVTSVSNTVTNIGNAISNFSLSGAASSLTGFLSSGLDKLKSLGLSALVQAGLPAAAAAQLNSAITGLSSGLVKIITPKIGFNTNNRSQLDAQTTALLGNVPTPNLTGTVPDSATAARSAVIERNNRINGIINQIETLTATRDSVNINYRDAKSKYTQAQNSLPQGDSTLIALQGQVNAAYAELSALDKQIADLRKQQLLNVTIT
jgi:hypothetical protein